MWFQHTNGDVVNLENGHSLRVHCVQDHRGVKTWEIISNSLAPGVKSHVLMSGFKTEDKARKALDTFLTDNDISPVSIEDPNKEDENESTGIHSKATKSHK